MQGLFKTILFLVIFYYAFKFLSRLFAPLLVKKATETFQKKAAQQFRGKQNNTNIKEGETIIDKKPRKQQQGNNSVGEYVDFEEIE